MIVDRISYKKVFPISSFCTEHIGLEASLDKGENPEEALNKLKVMVDTLHAETLTQLEEYRGTTVRDISPDKPADKIQAFKETLDMCKTVVMLERFKPQVDREKSEELTIAYNKKLKELTL